MFMMSQVRQLSWRYGLMDEGQGIVVIFGTG
jgi:hypothetical protein